MCIRDRDLGSALAAMAAMVVATVALERTPTRLSPSWAGILAWISVTLMVAMHLVSLFAAGKGSYTRCLSWPVWELLAADRSASGSAQVRPSDRRDVRGPVSYTHLTL